MARSFLHKLLGGLLLTLCAALNVLAAPGIGPDRISTSAPEELRDLFFGEALYAAFQGDWFDAVARLDTELGQFRRLDEPRLDSLAFHLGQAQFAVGDFELAYRMHQRAGRAIAAVIEGEVPETVRNEALYRLARIHFHKDQPQSALQAVERIRGEVPPEIVDDVKFLRAQLLMATGRYAEAAQLLRELEDAEPLAGFTGYNLGIALLKEGQEQAGRLQLEATGRLAGDDPAALAIRDKANLVLGYKLLDEEGFAGAKQMLDRVRLEGPFSNRALLGSGWADASRGDYERALVPWSILSEREVTDSAVQEALLALPYAYGELQVFGRAAALYGRALGSYGGEVDKLRASIASIREGKFLEALTREELKQDADWLVKLRELPEAPETYYLLELMASHDFQESLKNYLDLEELRRKLEGWTGDLDAFAELIELRRAYYRPLLPKIDRQFRRLDSLMRLRLEQREHIEQRLHGMLTAPRPDYLATAQERIFRERIERLEQTLAAGGAAVPEEYAARIRRLKGVLRWNIHTDYHRRLTETNRHLQQLNGDVAQLQRQYAAFVRTRQAATQSCEGYDETIRRQRQLITSAQEKVTELLSRQGHLLEVMAVNELTRRKERLEELQVKARFALADAFDRAARAQGLERTEP